MVRSLAPRARLPGWSSTIKEQEQHHRKMPFEEEYRKLLLEAGVEFDERYMQ